MSAWIMIPVMLLLKSYPVYVSLPVSSVIGAIIFWFIDKRIFK